MLNTSLSYLPFFLISIPLCRFLTFYCFTSLVDLSVWDTLVILSQTSPVKTCIYPFRGDPGLYAPLSLLRGKEGGLPFFPLVGDPKSPKQIKHFPIVQHEEYPHVKAQV